VRWWLRSTGRGRMLWARLVYAVPLAGTLIRSARLAAFADLLGILVDQSVPLPEALRLAGQASSDPLLAEGVKQVEADLNQGQPLGESLGRQKLVPQLVAWMTRFGERQGTLGSALHHIAQMFRATTGFTCSGGSTPAWRASCSCSRRGPPWTAPWP